MENEQLSRHIAKDEEVAVAKFSLFDCLFYGHGADCESLMSAEYMRLDDGGLARKGMHGDCCFGLFSRRTGDCRAMSVLLRLRFGGYRFQARPGCFAWSPRLGGGS